MFSCTLRALGPLSIIISIAKSSIAEYKYSSTTLFNLWISSMKKTSLWPKLVTIPARSPARSTTGPVACLIFEPNSLDIIFARVVLPKPGGPNRSTWSNASPRLLEASIYNFILSTSFSCPINSSNLDGRNDLSSVISSSNGAGSVM